MTESLAYCLNVSQSSRLPLPATHYGARVVGDDPPAALVQAALTRSNSRVHIAARALIATRDADSQEGANYLCGGWTTSPTWIDRATRGSGLLCAHCLSVYLGPAVYRLYDAADRLLYIGSTGNLRARLLSHANSTPWWSQVARVTDARYGELTAARDAEAAAIAAEHPLLNVRGRQPGAWS